MADTTGSNSVTTEKSERRPFRERAIDSLARIETGLLREAAREKGEERRATLATLEYVQNASRTLEYRGKLAEATAIGGMLNAQGRFA